LIGCTTMVACIVLQCLVVALLLLYLRRRNAQHEQRASFFEAARLLTESMLILMLGNLVQIGVWAALFLYVGEFSDFETAYYHSTVNFSTLGYGDIVMSEHRRLLGGLEAANGVLMFGLTTSALYAVIQGLSQRVLYQTPPKSDRRSRDDDQLEPGSNRP
ncbi:MAG TPA: potassium channel family protein, partial [Polyangiaceae bacterium]|nr:potassium channel family protein [Polyangiaceae bacterium]